MTVINIINLNFRPICNVMYFCNEKLNGKLGEGWKVKNNKMGKFSQELDG